MVNLSVTVIVSALTQNADDLAHKMKFHGFLRAHARLRDSKRGLIPIAWIATLVWFFFGIGPGAVVGNTIFGDPNDADTWAFGIPSIWAWQVLWWGLGVLLMWFLAYKCEMSTAPDKDFDVLYEDIRDQR